MTQTEARELLESLAALYQDLDPLKQAAVSVALLETAQDKEEEE